MNKYKVVEEQLRWRCNCKDPQNWRKLGNSWAGYIYLITGHYEVIHCKICGAKSPGYKFEKVRS